MARPAEMHGAAGFGAISAVRIPPRPTTRASSGHPMSCGSLRGSLPSCAAPASARGSVARRHRSGVPARHLPDARRLQRPEPGLLPPLEGSVPETFDWRPDVGLPLATARIIRIQEPDLRAVIAATSALLAPRTHRPTSIPLRSPRPYPRRVARSLHPRHRRRTMCVSRSSSRIFR
jgi:hypothetical protein